jgi:hypothetical protein
MDVQGGGKKAKPYQHVALQGSILGCIRQIIDSNVNEPKNQPMQASALCNVGNGAVLYA